MRATTSERLMATVTRAPDTPVAVCEIVSPAGILPASIAPSVLRKT